MAPAPPKSSPRVSRETRLSGRVRLGIALLAPSLLAALVWGVALVHVRSPAGGQASRATEPEPSDLAEEPATAALRSESSGESAVAEGTHSGPKRSPSARAPLQEQDSLQDSQVGAQEGAHNGSVAPEERSVSTRPLTADERAVLAAVGDELKNYKGPGGRLAQKRLGAVLGRPPTGPFSGRSESSAGQGGAPGSGP